MMLWILMYAVAYFIFIDILFVTSFYMRHYTHKIMGVAFSAGTVNLS